MCNFNFTIVGLCDIITRITGIKNLFSPYNDINNLYMEVKAMLELIIVLVVVLVVVSIGVYLFKTMAKLIIGLGIAYLIFHIGFLWDFEEFDSKVPIMDYFLPEYSAKFKTFYNELTEKRYEKAMLDIDKMESDIDITIKKVLDTAKAKYEEIDKEQLLNDLYASLQEYDFSEVKGSLIGLKDEFINSGITENDFNEIVLKLDEMSTQIGDINDRLDDIESGLQG